MLKLPLQTFFLWILRVSFLFTLLYIFRVEKHMLFNKFLSQKWQPIVQEERVGCYEGRKGMIFCMLYPWHRLLIEQHEHIVHICNDGADFSIKGEILAPSRLNILSIFLYWVQKSRVEKDNNKNQLLLSCHATLVWIFQ